MAGPRKDRIFRTPLVDCYECDTWGILAETRRIKGRSIPIQYVKSGPCPKCKGRGYRIGGLAGLVLEALYCGVYPYRLIFIWLRNGRSKLGVPLRRVWSHGQRLAKAQLKILTKEARSKYAR